MQIIKREDKFQIMFQNILNRRKVKITHQLTPIIRINRKEKFVSIRVIRGLKIKGGLT